MGGDQCVLAWSLISDSLTNRFILQMFTLRLHFNGTKSRVPEHPVALPSSTVPFAFPLSSVPSCDAMAYSASDITLIARFVGFARPLTIDLK